VGERGRGKSGEQVAGCWGGGGMKGSERRGRDMDGISGTECDGLGEKLRRSGLEGGVVEGMEWGGRIGA